MTVSLHLVLEACASWAARRMILLLAIWIGVGFIFRGVATVSAVSDKLLPGRGWEIFFGIRQRARGC